MTVAAMTAVISVPRNTGADRFLPTIRITGGKVLVDKKPMMESDWATNIHDK